MVGAGDSVITAIPASELQYRSNMDVFLTVTFTLKNSTSWADSGYEIAWAQHQLQTSANPLAQAVSEPERLPSQLDVSSFGSLIRISGDDFSFTFDRARGGLKTWIAKGKTLLEAAPTNGVAIVPGFWRPPTDNDVPVALPYWKRFNVHALTSQLRSLSIDTSSPNGVSINVRSFISPPVLAWGWDAEAVYTITRRGALTIRFARLTPTGYYPEHVPRIGLDLRLSRELDSVRWYGRGPGESYPDKGASQRVGIWASKSVADLQTPYDLPQENGNRIDTHWVTLSNGLPSRTGLRASRSGDSLFSFAASHHSAKTVEEAAHPPDLVEEDATLLRLDAQVAGLGTSSCGPGVREDHLVKCEETSFEFTLESF